MGNFGSARWGILPRSETVAGKCDYIVIGGGSTGCVVASRLSENADVSVVLLEEGPNDINPYIHIPGAYYKTAQGPLLKRIPWEPTAGAAFTTVQRAIPAVRAVRGGFRPRARQIAGRVATHGARTASQHQPARSGER